LKYPTPNSEGKPRRWNWSQR